MRRLVASVLAGGLLLAGPVSAQCGGEERWAVKMGADPGALQVDLQHPAPTTLHDLVRVPRPILPADDITRTAAERTVWVVNGRLVRFKKETGKTGDADFHLVISDETLLFSAGGTGPASPHSLIAEIPDPACVAGRDGGITAASRFATELAAVRARFTQQFPAVASGWNDAQGIPVRLTGVAFFDRPHGQVGRALNGLELHPLLGLEFTPAGAAGPIAATLQNPGFEDGEVGWTTTPGIITGNANEAAHTGASKAWLGGYGTRHTDRLWQQIAPPAGAHAVSLTFFLHIDSDEDNQHAYDKLTVRIRDGNGALLTTLKTFTNQHAAPGYLLQSFDLSPWRGRTIRIELEAREDNGSATSFVVDDFTLIVEAP